MPYTYCVGQNFSALQKLFARRFFILTKTEHYNLPQWEGSDRVLRTDFNEAMADIDAALQANADSVTALAGRSRFTKLKEMNITNYVTSAELNLSDVDWRQWDKVHVDILAPQAQQGNIDLNGNSENSYIGKFGGEYSEPGIYHPRLTFYPHFQTSRFVTLTYVGTTKLWLIPYSSVNKLLFTSNSINGISLIVWGEK